MRHQILILLACCQVASSFAPLVMAPSRRTPSTTTSTAIFAAAKNDGTKKRRRRRKAPPGATSIDPVKQSIEKVEGIEDPIELDEGDDNLTKDDVMQISDVANFEFERKADIMADVETVASDSPGDDAIPLPDIKQARKKKEMEAQLARMEEEKEEKRVKIKRSDSEAFRKLLEQQPFADADDSFFEEEEYGSVSALLGERAKPFLGIPFGPLQVGHFIGALGIVLMAFVEYPGFPLTNLPTPMRDALQGGLLTIYSINIVLAVVAVFRAGERGQPKGLWVAKTLSVGGLALDQLTQLPTLEQTEQAKNRKGARALKKNCK